MKKLPILAFLLLTAGLASAQNQYYASAAGSGSACSVGTPCTPTTAMATFALSSLGAVINFSPGNYGGAKLTINRGGNSNAARLTLVCTQQWSVPTSSGCIQLSFLVTSANFVTVGAVNHFGFDYTNPNDSTGYDVSWQCGTATTCASGNNLSVLGNYFHDIGQNVTGGCPQAGAILAPTGHAHTIQNFVANDNLIDHYGISGGSTCNEAHGIYVASAGGTIQNNLIFRAASGAIQYYDQACNATISNNVLAASRVGIIFFGANGCTPGINTITNNVIVNNSSTGIFEGTSGNQCSNGPPSRPLLVSNNDLFGNGQDFNVNPAACETRQNAKSENPTTTFTNYTGIASGTYTLKAGSIAIGGGTSSGVSGGTAPFVPANDIVGVVRPASGAQDIGAYVFAAGGVPIVSFTPSPLAFGTVAVSSNASLTATLTNTGAANLTFATAAAISGTNAADFSITSTTCTSPLAATLSCTYTIKFAPSASGARSANLTLNDNAAGSPHQLPLTGTGGTATLTLNPTSLSFGVIANGAGATCGAVQTTTVTSTGTSNLVIGVESIAGTNPGDFPFGGIGTCSNGQTLAPGAACTVSAKFCPTATGARSASISVTSNDPASPALAPMTGTGGAALVSLAPSSAACGSQQIGTSNTCHAFTLTNTGNIDLTGITISFTGTNASSFSQSNNCPANATLTASSSCTITVFFKPNTAGSLTGALSIASSATSSPNTAALTGTGATPATITLGPGSINFNSVMVGTTSSAQSVVLTNNGGSVATLTSITTSSPFALTHDCPISPTTLAVGGTCTISATATPVATGTVNGTFSVVDNTTGSPHVASLSVTGIAPVVSYMPASIAFGSQPVGSATSTQSFTLSNTGTGQLNIVITTVGTNPGDFVVTSGCGAALAPNAGCVINVAFDPTTTGARSAIVRVTDNASGSPHDRAITGTGVATAPAVCLSVNSVNFGNQPVSTSSASRPVVVTNCGTANLVISAITPTGNFTSTGCVATVAPNATCTIAGVFSPLAAGALTGQFSIASNSASTPDLVTLSGFGTQTGATLTSTAAFGHVVAGITSAIINLTLTNTGNTPLTLNTPAITGTNAGDFNFGTSCGATLAANATCQLSATFTPTTTGARSATLTQSFAGGVASVTSALTGTGDAATPAVTNTPTSVDFGSVNTGVLSGIKTVQIQNSGNSLLTFASITLTGTNSGDYALTSHCGATLAAGSVCTVDLTVTPGGAGSRTANLHLVDDAASSPQNVTLTVTGVPSPVPHVTVPASIAFSPPSIQTGTTSAAQPLTLVNNGNASLIVASAVLGGTNPGDFTLANGCGTVTAGNSCTITLNCVPTAAGSRTATVTIVDNTSTSPHTTNLACTGFVGTPTLILAVSQINFGNQTVGTTSAPLVFTLTNTGLATATSVVISAIGDFGVTDTCSGSITSGSSCSASVTFSPLVLCGQFDPNNTSTCLSDVHLGAISVASNTSNSPQSISLQGTAVPVPAPLGPITTSMTGHINVTGHAAVH